MAKTDKKTIVFSTYDDVQNPYYAGGGARAIYEVAKGLTPYYNVVVLTGNYPGAKNETTQNITYKRIGPASFGPKIGQLVFHLLLPFALKKESFDIWIESFTPPFSTTALQKFTTKPVIGLAHMLSSEDMQRKYKLPFFMIERKGLHTYKYFITITEKTKDVISQFNSNAKFFVIPNGVDLKKGRKLKSSDKNYILFLGRVEVNQKGIDLLLEAFSQIENKTNAKLIIAGSGTKKEEKTMRNIIQQKHLEKKVILKGRVDGAVKEQLLQNASLVAVPSRYETFGNVVLEAMAYGKPVIGFAIDGLQWVPTRCMIKVKQFDTRQFGQQLLSALNNKNTLRRMEKAAINAVKNYSWHATALAYKETIEAILDGNII